jgi:hypothetical protein
MKPIQTYGSRFARCAALLAILGSDFHIQMHEPMQLSLRFFAKTIVWIGSPDRTQLSLYNRRSFLCIDRLDLNCCWALVIHAANRKN